jgi:predicted ribosome quality control (RQC) complex YloA/Tae2 family protein
MEGLTLAAALAPLQARLPCRHMGWRFADATTLVLPLDPPAAGALWLELAPPAPRLTLAADAADARVSPFTPFQAQLRARAVGALEGADQAALDRRCTLRFGAGAGFVPSPPVWLEVELTGRHANAILRDEGGRILGVLREVGLEVNRHRQLRPGLTYRPPPPYHKLDPRDATAAALRAVLQGQPLARAHTRVDGVGRDLTTAWARVAQVDPQEPLEGAALERAVEVLGRLAADPLGVLAGSDDDGGHAAEPGGVRRAARAGEPSEARRADALTTARAAARARLADRVALLRERLRDADRAEAAAHDAAGLRAEADLLLAYAHQLERGAAEVTLPGFDGAPVRLRLAHDLDAAGNARARYQQARKREARAERARAHRAEVEAELARLEADAARVGELGVEELERLVPPRKATRERRGAAPGLRLYDPRGFEVVIGRSARENDLVTFRVARSDDVWLHAQGYHGAHVVVRAEGREVPFDTVRFAAELAAGHSEAGQGDNVPVDYALRKDVWRRKGMPPGAVHYTRQKTVFVTPRRRSEVE